jgi:hypothetical protein
MAYYSDIVSSIREKFVGTAIEHDLLRNLQDDASNMEAKVRSRIEDDYRERLDSLQHREDTCRVLASNQRIDEAVFQWLRNQPTTSTWEVGEVASAMMGRGLTVEHLQRVIEHMKLIKSEQ